MWAVCPGLSSLTPLYRDSLSWPAVLGCEWKSKRKESRHVFLKLNWILKRYIQSACLITRACERLRVVGHSVYILPEDTLALYDCE